MAGFDPSTEAFADDFGADSFTTELFLEWRKQFEAPSDVTWGCNLSHVRGFAKWLHCLDPRTEVPSADLIRRSNRRPRPSPRRFRAHLHGPAEYPTRFGVSLHPAPSPSQLRRVQQAQRPFLNHPFRSTIIQALENLFAQLLKSFMPPPALNCPLLHRCRVGGGAPRGRWPPSAAQTVRAVFPYTAFTKTSSRDEDRWRNQRVDPPPARRVQPVGKSPRSLMFGVFHSWNCPPQRPCSSHRPVWSRPSSPAAFPNSLGCPP